MNTTRREFLKSAGLGAVVVASGTGAARLLTGTAAAADVNRELVATDGYITLPGRDDPLYIFGFREPDQLGESVDTLVNTYKNHAQHVAPILDFTEGDDIHLGLTNLGLKVRPDLVDSHTIHWHGFRTPLAVFDGVPEVSIAVPELRKFTYFYRPHDPGTYMYHCHFEDVEHVQMGMTGIVFVRPAGHPKWCYADASTRFDREFPILLNEIWTEVHDNDENIQETIHTDYNPDYFTLNGRVYPQTILPTGDHSLPSQPVSSLIQVNPGNVALLRLANLGYQQHAMQLPGIPLKVVGEDANLLKGPGPNGADLSYFTNTLFLGPGEARDVLFTAPDYDGSRDGGSDGHGPYNTYLFHNRSANKLSNPNTSGLGGMATEVRVYKNGLPPQTTAGGTV
jgi:FtsP/CotA-like multicopper oxidase with cupredoxin domain